jgi:site-specific recombinase XerD
VTDLEPIVVNLPSTERTDADDELRRMTAGWLLAQRSINTRIAYQRDVLGIGTNGKPAIMAVPSWIAWCEERDLHPLDARRGDVDAYRHNLEGAGSSPATIARKLSAISSWYDYLVIEEVAERNPAKAATRPEISRDVSNAVGLTQAEADRLITAADEDGLRSSALIRMLLFNGVRVSVATDSRMKALGYDQGHRTITLRLKGGRIVKAPIVAPVLGALDAYHADRGALTPEDLIFVTSQGRALDEPYIWRLVRRLARRAEIAAHNQLNPHGLRHAFATLALSLGVPLAVVQDAMGHLDPRTTQRYNRARHQLDNHPAHKLAAHLAQPAEPLPHDEDPQG